jgi:microcystin-dependent protein
LDGTRDITGSQTIKNSSDAELTVEVDSGVTTTQNAQLDLSDRGTPRWRIRKDASNNLLIIDVNTGNTVITVAASAIAEAIFIDSAGNLGIGTSLPGEALDVDGNILVRGGIEAANGADSSNAIVVDSGSTTEQESQVQFKDRGGLASWTIAKTSAGVFVIRDGSGNEPIEILDGATSGTLQIDASGNVGIGTAPTTPLEVDGIITSTGLDIIGGATIAGNVLGSGLVQGAIVKAVTSFQLPTGDIDDTAGTSINVFESVVPVGACVPFGGSSPPSGWALCDGSELNRVTFADLFDVIGTSYGVGNGVTTFNLPDLRSGVPVGLDSSVSDFDALGKTGGEKDHTLTIDELAAHTHTIETLTNSFGGLKSLNGLSIAGPDQETLSTGGDQPHNNMPPYVIVNWIIKT